MKRSILAPDFEKLGANMIVYRDWSIPGSFTSIQEEATSVSQGVGLTDVSWIAKLCLHRDGILPELPESARLWTLTPLRQLITCDPECREDVLRSFGLLREKHRKVLNPLAGVFDVTHLYSDLLVAGPKARMTLEALANLDLSDEAFPNHSCVGTFVARMQTIMMRQDLGEIPAYHLLVNTQYSHSLWSAILGAGERDGVAPFGFHALRLLASRASGAITDQNDQWSGLN